MSRGRAVKEFLQRRRFILATIVIVVTIAALVVAVRDYSRRPYIVNGQLFVSALAVGSPSRGSPSQPVDLERAARLMAEDLKDVGASTVVATDVARYVNSHGKARITASDIMHWVSTSSSGSTVTVSVATSSSSRALMISSRMLTDLSLNRDRFIGPAEARRESITIIGPPSLSRTPAKDIITTFGVRMLLGILVAVGVALAWDYLDDSVHDPADVERSLAAPMLARAR